MKKINLKGISEILSEKELKNVMGGSSTSSCSTEQCTNRSSCGSGAGYPGNNYCVHTTIGCQCATAG